MEGSPLKALPVEYADLRRRVMNENGIHIIYPLGRDYGLSLDGSMDMFEGLTIRVIGYTYYPGSNYEIAIGGRDRVAYALMKWSGNYPYALLKPSSGRAYYETGSEAHYYGDAYSFAIRARYDNSKGESYQTIIFESSLNAVAFSWYGATHWEILHSGSNVHLSKHIYVVSPFVLPLETGLDKILKFVKMEIGTIAHYSGIYKGPSEIRVIAPGAVRDLARPVHSGITVRITVRKTMDYILFFADYATEPVVAQYRDLVTAGQDFVPHFTPNFNVRHVYVEVYT